MRSALTLSLIVVLLLQAKCYAAGEPLVVEKLEKTPIFAFGGIGIAGTVSEGEAAFHALSSSDSAESDFLRLLKTGNAQAKCYALVGLRVKSRALFNEQVKQFVSSKEEVQTCAGCMMSKLPMSSVVKSIQHGDYDEPAKVEPRKRP